MALSLAAVPDSNIRNNQIVGKYNIAACFGVAPVWTSAREGSSVGFGKAAAGAAEGAAIGQAVAGSVRFDQTVASEIAAKSRIPINCRVASLGLRHMVHEGYTQG